MTIDKIGLIKNSVKVNRAFPSSGNFKDVIHQKRTFHPAGNVTPEPIISPSLDASSIKRTINKVMDDHKVSAESIKSFLTRTDYSPEKLMMVQYKTGLLFFRQQMFSKSAEMSANALKSFTQMQV